MENNNNEFEVKCFETSFGSRIHRDVIFAENAENAEVKTYRECKKKVEGYTDVVVTVNKH